jgi:hypothetical protein
MSLGYWETLASAVGDGTALTAAARASLLQGSAKSGLYTMAANRLRIGDRLAIKADGRVSSAITTPGTYRWDLSWGVAGTAGFDTTALTPITASAQTNIAWILDVQGTVRAVGSTGNIFWQGTLMCSALLTSGTVAALVVSSGGIIMVPNVSPPAVGSNVDMSIAQILDFNWTQTVTTGSVTLHNYELALKSSSGF